ncbi:cryptochrome DASH [Arenicella chitinivorans]|uniref:Cryptochrome DASH n=1 Tax=Arenicella chitinivorans TaxID=1329800 RepID=A0A918RL00_9GAMM|nr:DASH family cryptochrome [Arenicella chitinivorans]GHA01087.1 cryptochrome DASH [Arenicella chitinivorans]
MARTGLFWFTNDLRLHDNPALQRAVSSVDSLVCVYVLESRSVSPSSYSAPSMGQSRFQFLRQSLLELQRDLRTLGQKLLVVQGSAASIIPSLIRAIAATDVFRSRNPGWYENRDWAYAKAKCGQCTFHTIDSHTLFDIDTLPVDVADIPATFTRFRKLIDAAVPSAPIVRLNYLPPPARFRAAIQLPTVRLLDSVREAASEFNGGESAALSHMEAYFSSDLPTDYKQVRNALDGWDNSTKFSPWLANGNLSVRELVARLRQYESSVAANESTYWIYFELLWREFFQWHAHQHGASLFSLSGVKHVSLVTSFYPERYQKWIAGNTPYPLVNAGMRELAATGYLSNRGRQIVASCFVNELGMDWRYGAAYFEQVLLDYDVASNWGNWQYLAGVGADVQPKRHFNLAKQAATFDPDGAYVARWQGAASLLPLDSVDAADWPV